MCPRGPYLFFNRTRTVVNDLFERLACVKFLTYRLHIMPLGHAVVLHAHFLDVWRGNGKFKSLI